MLKIFVSHAWDDKVQPQFGQVYQELKGYELLIDKTELNLGKNIQEGLRELIKETDVFLLLWSKNAAASDDVNFEIETAFQSGKSVLPCIIDDYSLDNSSYLKGSLYVDLRETQGPATAMLGWMKVRHYLADIFISKYTIRMESYSPEAKEKAAAMLEDIKKSQVEMKNQISLIEDSMFRKSKDAPDRNKNNPYINNMLDTLIGDMNTGNPADKKSQVAQFMLFSKEMMAKYPKDDKVSLKIRNARMLEKMLELDPNGENEYLEMLKGALMND